MDKVICIGKNYREHTVEMGESQPQRPVLFLKPPSVVISVAKNQGRATRLKLPPGEVHHELEVVFKLTGRSKGLFHEVFSHFTLGLDLTRRDLQSQLKKQGHPWEIAKVFFGSALVGEWQDLDQWPLFQAHEFKLLVRGQERQRGWVKDMIFSPEHCLQLAGEFFPLVPGDLLFTGTPAGVGPLVPGDVVQMIGASDLVFGEAFF